MSIHGTKRSALGLAIERHVGWDGRRVGNLVVVCVLERPEEFLVSVNVLAAVGLYAGVNRTFGAFVGECLGEAFEVWYFDVLHCAYRSVLNVHDGEEERAKMRY